MVMAIAATTGFSLLFFYILMAVLNGNLSIEGPAIMNMPWGLVTLIDLYLGLTLFSFWVIWREAYRFKGFCWALMVLCLGNMVSCLYILKTYLDVKGNIHKFWLGVQCEKLDN